MAFFFYISANGGLNDSETDSFFLGTVKHNLRICLSMHMRGQETYAAQFVFLCYTSEKACEKNS